MEGHKIQDDVGAVDATGIRTALATTNHPPVCGGAQGMNTSFLGNQSPQRCHIFEKPTRRNSLDAVG
jgi:hypothetical protein